MQPPSLRETGAGVEWLEDSHFDQAIHWASFDGNYVGFGTIRDTTRTLFLLKLKLNLWKDQKESVQEKGEQLKEIDPFLDSLDVLSTNKQEALWSQLGHSLDSFRTAVADVTGLTKEPTGRALMKLPGHSQLHREIQVICDVRKDVFAVEKQRRDMETPLLLTLLQRLVDCLKSSSMTVPTWTDNVNRESLLAETSSLLKEREDSVDTETRDKRNENFKELSKSLQGSFNMGGARTMKVVTGKMSGSRG
eukprot:826502-Rhodomonas_salina.1